MHDLQTLKGNKFRQFPAISLLNYQVYLKRTPVITYIFQMENQGLTQIFLKPFEWRFT